DPGEALSRADSETLMGPSEKQTESKWRRRLYFLTGLLCRVYLITILAIWALIAWAGDRWWPTTLFLFGPRWVTLLPLILLVPAAAAIRRRSLTLVFLSLLVVLVPLMGWNIPWGSLTTPSPSGFRLRVLTCNVDQGMFDADALTLLIGQEQP